MARLADSNLVCMDDGTWHVWGPVRRFPDEADVKKAEEALRTLWRARIAVPAYNYGSWQGCMEYVPWSEWRAERRPTLDSPCFTTDYAEMDRRIYAKAGKDEDGEEQEEGRCPGATDAVGATSPSSATSSCRGCTRSSAQTAPRGPARR